MAKATEIQMNPYEKLSQTLDTIPNGFMTLEDGTHLRMLEWIYEPWEADLASKLKLAGETLRRMARRLRMSRKDLAKKLSIMEKKGQLHIIRKKRGIKYGLLPFVIGLYEEQIHRMDAEFAQLFENYVQKTRGELLFTSEPPIQRVVPV
ncbi:MAG: 4Fe-4S ferredoxin, partial [Candidatus Heimdallarchaeota archaeon]|nr:4Fe-4S ferredoxin [Candidatus Heimdallarchaeota archaeon]